MSSSKRNFDDFTKFPGEIDETKSTYVFPTLLTKDKSNKTRFWTVHVRLIKKSSCKHFKTNGWNLLEEIQVPVVESYLTSELPKGTIAEMWTETQIENGALSRSAPTYPKDTNVGKSNHRDSFKQGLVLARTKYLKKQNDGGKIASEFGSTVKQSNVMYFPMLANNIKNFKKTLEFPVFVQPKLDGTRCIVYLNAKATSAKATSANVIMYTRHKNEYPHNTSNDAIRKSVLDCLVELYGKYESDESVYLDGELYNHNLKLQDINHYVRKGDLGNAESLIQYWIYDAFYPSQKQTFRERTNTLNEVARLIPQTKSAIVMTETLEVQDQKELDAQYKHYIKNGYEGMMIRNPNGMYKSGIQNVGLRTDFLLKRKEVFTDEYEVVDYTDGKAGKEIGAVIWVCQNKSKKRFNVTPNMKFVDRYKIYKECQKSFSNKYANRMLIVEYRGKSDDDIPQHAKGIAFRDVE